jgi:hypothetical protein
MTTASITASVHTVERTVRIFVHSDFRACPRLVGWTGTPPAEGSGPGADAKGGCGTP